MVVPSIIEPLPRSPPPPNPDYRGGPVRTFSKIIRGVTNEESSDDPLLSPLRGTINLLDVSGSSETDVSRHETSHKKVSD